MHCLTHDNPTGTERTPMNSPDYHCPSCQWHGPKAKEERYSVVQQDKLVNAFRYVCPHCGMDVWSPGADPRLTATALPRRRRPATSHHAPTPRTPEPEPRSRTLDAR